MPFAMDKFNFGKGLPHFSNIMTKAKLIPTDGRTEIGRAYQIQIMRVYTFSLNIFSTVVEI